VYAQKPDWRRYLLVAALFAAGLMAKPMVITLLLYCYFWIIGRWSERRSTKPERSGHLQRATAVGSQGCCWRSATAVSFGCQRMDHSHRATIRSAYSRVLLRQRIENALVALALLWKMLWQQSWRSIHSVTSSSMAMVLSALVLISVTALVIIFRSTGYLPLAGSGFWDLNSVLGLVQVGEFAMADRYAYVPLIGIFVMIASALRFSGCEASPHDLARHSGCVC